MGKLKKAKKNSVIVGHFWGFWKVLDTNVLPDSQKELDVMKFWSKIILMVVRDKPKV